MNKKLNTFIFIVVGTIVDFILAFIIAVALLTVLYFCRNLIPPNVISLMVPVAVIVGIIIAMLIYQRLAAWFIGKFNLEDKLSPIFKTKRDRMD